MSPESCFKVLVATGKPRYISLRQSRPYQPRACFLFRLSLRVGPFLRWPALKCFSSTRRFQPEKYWAQICTAVAYTARRRKNWTTLLHLVQLLMCVVNFVFHLGLLTFVFAHTYLIFTPGHFFFTQWPTHPPCKVFALTRIASQWNVGGWRMVLVLVEPTSARTIRRTSKPLTHQPTSIYPYQPIHHARFLRRRASLNSGSDPKTIAGAQ